jgi:hypothetical protein
MIIVDNEYYMEKPGNIKTVRPDITEDIVKPIDEQGDENTMKSNSRAIIGVYVVLFVLGVGTGYLLAGRPALFTKSSGAKNNVASSGQIVGSSDTTTFKDSAQGTLEKGGFDGEGSHKLIREGGPSQTAYLVSSVVDLDKYVGKKVQVWGQTVTAKNVSWLMDVGKIQNLSE